MIKIRISKPALEEFQQSEYGSWEDAGCPDTGHVYAILQRHIAQIEVRDDAEAAEVFCAVCSGTFQLEYKGFLRTARRIANALREAAARHDPEVVHLWSHPTGL